MINFLSSVNYRCVCKDSRLYNLRFSCDAASSPSVYSPWAEERPGPVTLSSTEAFTSTASICREFLSTFLAGTVLDSLSEAARQVRHVTRDLGVL